MIILGLVNYDALVKGLYELHVPNGVSVDIGGKFPQLQGGGGEYRVLNRKSSAVLYTVPVRTLSAGAELLFSWHFDDRFSDGPNTNLANAMLIFGIGMSIFTAVFISFLLSQNRIIRTRVNEATAELSEALETISSSIDYASHIQRSILPPDSAFGNAFSDHFVIWQPRNVVGGDIYWLRTWGKGTLLVLGDCTGHGVPGAFMTMISTAALDRAQAEVPVGDVSALVQRMHQLVQSTLTRESGESSESREGMELGVCYFETTSEEMIFCGAHFSLFVASPEGVDEIRGGRKGIGYARLARDQIYEAISLPTSKDRTFFLTTDGFLDQIGGENRRCFGKRRFIDSINACSHMPLDDLKTNLSIAFEEYRGEHAQLDDVAILGFRI